MFLFARIKVLLIGVLSFLSCHADGMASTNYKDFSQQIHDMKMQLNVGVIHHDQLFVLTSRIFVLQKQIDQCIQDNEKKLNEINTLLVDTNVTAILEKEQKIKAGLKSQKEEILEAVGECKLLNYQIQELSVRAHTLRGYKFLFRLFEKTPLPSLMDVSFDLPRLYDNSGLAQFSIFDGVIFGFLIFTSIGLSGWVYKRKVNIARQYPSVEVAQNNLVVFFPFGVMAIYFNIVLPQSSIFVALFNEFLSMISIFLLVRFGLMMAVKNKLWMYEKEMKFIFNGILFIWIIALFVSIPFHILSEFFISPIFSHFEYDLFIVWVWLYIAGLSWYQADLRVYVKTILGYLSIILGFVFLRSSVEELFEYQVISRSAYSLAITLYILGFNFILSWIIWLVIKQKKINLKILSNNDVNRIFLCLTYVVSLMMLFAGYFFAAENIFANLIITVSIFAIIFNFIKLSDQFHQYFLLSRIRFSKKIIEKFGLKYNEKPMEVYLFSWIVNAGAFAIMLSGIFIAWGGSFNELNFLVRKMQTGFVFFSMTIYPGMITHAIFSFCCILIFGRFLATYVSHLPRFSIAKHTQVTIHSMIRYVVFVIACLNALLISGVNITHIALVTGALSFGLGFGLQHFASDLVSGLFLLINRPVKIGDHIAVDNEEGFIRNIGLFSTQISTLEQADVIIPNSNLITKSLKNFTFENNKFYTIKINIMPPEGADLQVCHRLLLEVAKKNKSVVNTTVIHPIVLFDKNLLSLCCTIINVNKKEIVISELSFAIAQIFAQNNIPITLS